MDSPLILRAPHLGRDVFTGCPSNFLSIILKKSKIKLTTETIDKKSLQDFSLHLLETGEPIRNLYQFLQYEWVPNSWLSATIEKPDRRKKIRDNLSRNNLTLSVSSGEGPSAVSNTVLFYGGTWSQFQLEYPHSHLPAEEYSATNPWHVWIWKKIGAHQCQYGFLYSLRSSKFHQSDHSIQKLAVCNRFFLTVHRQQSIQLVQPLLLLQFFTFHDCRIYPLLFVKDKSSTIHNMRRDLIQSLKNMIL